MSRCKIINLKYLKDFSLSFVCGPSLRNFKMSELSAFEVYQLQSRSEKKNLNKIKKKDNKFKKNRKVSKLKDRIKPFITKDIIENNCELIGKQNFSTDTIKKSDSSLKVTSKLETSLNHLNGKKNESDSDSDEPPKLIPIKLPNKKKVNDSFKKKKAVFEQDFIVKKPKKPLVLNPDKINITETLKQNFDESEEIHEDAFLIGEDIFKYLITPTNPTKFFNDYWEKKVLHIPRNCNGYYSSLISSEKLDSILRNNSLYYTKNVDIVSYENGKRETLNPLGRAVPSAVWDFYANGCSVRILNPQSYSSKLHALVSSLQEYFGNMVGTNLYLTPPGSQGFAPHYDDIEAFVIQIEGKKHWKIYSPKNETEVLPRYSSANFNREELSKPIMQVTLEAGDCLYFPRGFIHEACTDEGSHSLHITVSVYQKTTFVDLLEHVLPNALQEASKNDVEFRKGLPLHYLRHLGSVNHNQDSNLKRQILKKIDNLLNKLKEHINVDDAVDELGRKFMHDAMPPFLLDGEVCRTSKEDGERLINGQVVNRVEFDLDNEVRLLRYHSLRLVKKSNVATIYYCTENALVYHDQEEQMLDIEITHSGVIEMLQNTYPDYIKIGELPLDDDIAKMQIISDLWEHGLIVTKEPLDIIE